MNKLIILDPSLKSFNGHFLTYDNVIATAARNFGYATTVYASASVQTLPCDFEIVPIFRIGLEHNFFNVPLFNRFRAHTAINRRVIHRTFVQDLTSGMEVDPIESGTIVYLHTTTFNQIPPLVDWVKRNRHIKLTIFVMLRYSPSPNPYYPLSGGFDQYHAALTYLEESGVADVFRLTVDSDMLQEEYSMITSQPIHLLPIPHTMDHAQAESNVGGIAGPKLLSYLGNARSTKGYQYLPALIEAIKPQLEAGEWAAEFQSNVMFFRDKESVVSLALMRRMPVKLLEHELSLDQYNDLLVRSALVLIPYQLLYYHSQTSGVLCEALGAGKPVVVPSGTWMAKQIKGKDIGVTFYPGDRVSFVDSTRSAMCRIDELSANARAQRAEWVSYHNPENFMRRMLELA